MIESETKVYEIVKNCAVSYCDENEEDTGIALYKGDLIFIKPGAVLVREETKSVPKLVKKDLLVKIVYRNLTYFDADPKNTKYEWKEVIQNIVDPLVTYNSFIGRPILHHMNAILKDVTIQYERDRKLESLLK